MDETVEREFQRLVLGIDVPMYVVTTVNASGERSGCLVGFATQCSIHPPRFFVGLSEKNHTYRVAATADHLAVHVLDKDERELAELFGGETGDEIDKFERCVWSEGVGGVPIIGGIQAWFVGRILERVDLGDHLGHLLEPVAAHAAPAENLEFGEVRDIDPGHDP